MSGFTVREYRAEDIPALKALWLACFDDTPRFVDEFFAALPAIGGGVVSEGADEILGAAYTIDALELVSGGAVAAKVGYIYGVGVYEAARGQGIGAALDRAVYGLSRARGAEIITTLPAEDSLYGWYEDILGVKAAFYRESRVYDCAARYEACAEAVRISTAEYGAARESMFSDTPHIRLSPAALEFEETLLSEYGGGLYAVGGGIAAGCMEDGRAVIKELLLPAVGADVPGTQGARESAAQGAACAVGAAMGAGAVVLLTPAEHGEKYIAADAPFPAGCIWNLSFD